MTKKLTKVAMTTALAAAAIVPAVVATPAQAAEAEVTFAKAYYSTANGTAAFEADKLAGVISATTDTGITHLEVSNGEVFTMQAFSAYLAVNPTATTDEVLTALSKAGKALSADQVKALDVKEGKVDGGKVTVDSTAVQKTALNEAIAKAEASPKAAELKDAIAAAKAVAEKADATQAEVDAAVKALNEAIAEAEAADKTALEEAITKAEASPKAAELKDAIAVAKAVAENPDATQAEVDEAVKALNEAVEAAESKLTVESVSAINQTIAKSTNTDLKFKVNGDEYTKASFDEKFGEEGYTVEFKYNFSTPTTTERAGTVNKSVDFKYAVEVSQDGEKFNTATSADFVEVKVVDKDVATSVQAIQLETSAGEWKSSTVSASDVVKIVASEYSNALGQSNLDKDENDALVVPSLSAPEVEKVTSSDVTVAYYDLNSDNKIVVLADGEVTLTVKFKGIKEAQQIKVKTLATQDVTAISADAQKVKADTVGQNVSFKVLDQNNEAVRVDQTEVFYTLTKSGDVEAEAVSVKTDATGKASVDVNKEAGNYTVNVYTKADKKTKIGSFTVEAINVDAEAVIDSYELSFADEDITSVDLNPGKLDDGANELTVNAKASISGINVDLPANVKVKSSDAKILTAVEENELATDGEITVTGVKPGKANVVLYTEEGDLVTTLATLEVEVVNTATQFTTLTLKPDTKVDGKATNLKQAVIDAVKEEVTVDQIKKVTALAADGKVLVEFEAAYGGKTIALDATFIDTSLTKATAAIVKAADTDAEYAVATTTEELNVSTIIENGTIKVADNTYTVGGTGFDLDALNSAIADTGVVAEGDANALVLTKADGTDFTYSATKDGTEVLVDESTADNGTEAVDAVEGEVQSGTITLTFSEAVNVDANATIKINSTIEGTVGEAVEGEKTVTITLDAINAKKVENDTVVTTLDLKAINGSDIVLPEGDATVKITVATTVAP